jgi:hypothetical protein
MPPIGRRGWRGAGGGLFCVERSPSQRTALSIAPSARMLPNGSRGWRGRFLRRAPAEDARELAFSRLLRTQPQQAETTTTVACKPTSLERRSRMPVAPKRARLERRAGRRGDEQTNKRNETTCTSDAKKRPLRPRAPLRGAARAEGAIIRGLVTNANAKYAPSIRGSQWDQWEHTDGGGEFERTNERTNCVPRGSNPGAGLGVPGRLGVVRMHQGVLFGCWPLSYERANDRALRSARRGYGGRAGCPSA